MSFVSSFFATRPSTNTRRRATPSLLAIVALIALQIPAVAFAASSTILKSEDVAKLVPATVFFRGQVASVQGRNAGGVKFSDDMFTICALVDTSGYSTAVQQKYQAYFITEVPLAMSGQILKPGAYGVGFIAENKFLVMDLGAHDLFMTTSTRDAALKRPMPLQFLPGADPEEFRLYINRNYIAFSRATGQ